MAAELPVGFLRRKPKPTSSERRTQELLDQMKEQEKRIARLRATGTVVTVRVRQGRSRP